MSAVEKETRLETILPDTTSLCGQIESKSKELKELLDKLDDVEDGDEAVMNPNELSLRIEGDVYVLQQVRPDRTRECVV